MSDILCIYYSRTGNTRAACEAIAAELGAETVALQDEADRAGALGWLRCGLDAVRKSTRPLAPYHTEKPLSAYKLVLVGTPIWAGRCSSVVRAFLKQDGLELNRVGYVVTRSGENKYREIYRQMDGYLKQPHLFAVSLQWGSVGCPFWQEQFIRAVQGWLESPEAPLAPLPEEENERKEKKSNARKAKRH